MLIRYFHVTELRSLFRANDRGLKLGRYINSTSIAFRLGNST